MPTKGRTLRPRESQSRRERDALYERKRASDPVLAQAKKIRNSARWQRVRNWVKRRQPLCVLCRHVGRIEAAAEVHHIQAIVKRPDLAYSVDNLAALCSSCHANIEASERAGEDTSKLFVGVERET